MATWDSLLPRDDEPERPGLSPTRAAISGKGRRARALDRCGLRARLHPARPRDRSARAVPPPRRPELRGGRSRAGRYGAAGWDPDPRRQRPRSVGRRCGRCRPPDHPPERQVRGGERCPKLRFGSGSEGRNASSPGPPLRTGRGSDTSVPWARLTSHHPASPPDPLLLTRIRASGGMRGDGWVSNGGMSPRAVPCASAVWQTARHRPGRGSSGSPVRSCGREAGDGTHATGCPGTSFAGGRRRRARRSEAPGGLSAAVSGTVPTGRHARSLRCPRRPRHAPSPGCSSLWPLQLGCRSRMSAVHGKGPGNAARAVGPCRLDAP
mgnify:CR=1 FL=1